ncbi:Chibby family [Catenaria anguillulae PL171]|uniref:Chibby family n=1 Tax=Catenaria anguillulae PL171 TaxID=765915 RepID=A0A1Y2HDF7_9FUNG|nr:Chibby family [Catenaria anguillulae PL171]
MSSALETVRKHTRRMSESLKRSPIKEPRSTNIDDHPAPISLLLDGNEMVYENGIWVAATADGMQLKEQLTTLVDRNQQLQEENQLLKFKLELLMDMLAVTKLDVLRLQEAQRH